MPGMVGTTSDVEIKLRSLLGKLRSIESGQARIANLCYALEAKHVCVDRLRDLVTTLRHPSDNFDAYDVLTAHIRGQSRDFYFQRPSPPIWDNPVALVLDWTLLDEATPFHLFSDQYIASAGSSRTHPERATTARDLDDALNYVRTGFRQGLGSVGLGEPFARSIDEKKTPSGRVVFVTPVDEFWDKLTAGRFRGVNDPFPDPGPADQACDYLGLAYRSTWLVELRSRLTLSELVRRGGLSLAAPTVIEAWGHDYFRQWPRDAAVDCWGRTLHVGNGLVGAAEPQGLPEAIIDHLPPALLSEAFEVSILGRVTARKIPTQKDINDFLVAQRDLTVLVEDIVSKVAT
jgi:hypothetical protein